MGDDMRSVGLISAISCTGGLKTEPLCAINLCRATHLQLGSQIYTNCKSQYFTHKKVVLGIITLLWVKY